MGLTKDYMERLGGGNPDACLGRPVCANCFGDEGLAQIVEGSATSNRCDFCETESDEVIAADLFDVMEHVVEVLSFHYSTAENELPYESAEGGYQGQWWNTMELVQEVLALELPNDENGELLEAIVDSLPDNSWCENNPFSLTHGERLRFSWEEFCHCLKHERRFLFLLATDAEDADDGVPHSEEIFPPRKMLEQLEDLHSRYGLVRELPAGTRFHRARLQKEGQNHITARALGPPEEDRAGANRMSPAGIVMMYVSENAETAVRETATGPATFAIGEFETLKAIPILDLNDVPEAPSFFQIDYEDPYRREELIFLSNFSHDIAEPIERDGRVHIEYVPTQVVTEYVRIRLKNEDGSPILGIRYPSARHVGHLSLVLFADRRHVEPSDGDPKEDRSPFVPQPWIRLVGHSEREVEASEIQE